MSESGADMGRVSLDVDGHIARLTIDRPRKLNALTLEMLRELDTHLQAIEREHGIRVVVVTGAGERAFCVGADINAWSAFDPLDMWRIWVREGHRVFDRLAALRQPTIAAVNGLAFGGGLELALAADLRVAAVNATFALPETTIGTVPGWGGTQRLPALIGPARAKQMIFSGAPIDAPTAETWGLVNEVAAWIDLHDRCQKLAMTIAANAPVSVQLAKVAIDGSSVSLEALAGALAAGTRDGREGIAAFREKRQPRFTGE